MPTKAELNTRIRHLEAQVLGLNKQIGELQSQVASLTSEKLELQKQMVSMQGIILTKNSELEVASQKNAALTDQVTALTDQNNDLKQQLEDCQNPPEPPKTTLMGVTVTGGVRKNLPDLHDDVAVSRVFGAGTQTWSAEDQHKAFPNGKWAVSNSYELSEANLEKYLATIPDADKNKIVAYADGHELENPDKGLKPADVKARMRRTAPVIRAAGLRPAFCLMQWTLVPASGRNWLDWVDPDAVDVFAWDAYNPGAKNDTYTTPANILDRIVAISKQYGKPFQIWETGTDNFGLQSARVTWTKALRAEMEKEKAEVAIWFDRPSTSGSSWDATLDRPTAEAWLL